LINFPTPFSHNFYKIKWENPGIYKILGPESGKNNIPEPFYKIKWEKLEEMRGVYKIWWEKMGK
jgi:hypothetical protein